MMFFVFPNGFADRNTVVPNFNLMNQASLEKILKAEVFVHTDGITKGCSPDFGLHSNFQHLPSIEMHNQGKGLTSTKDQCSYSGVSYYRFNPKGHTCHWSNSRGHP